MPKKTILPEYETDIARELIRQHIHDEIDRVMLDYRLNYGYTFKRIADLIYEKFGILYEEKTIRTHVHKGEEIVFRYYPG